MRILIDGDAFPCIKKIISVARSYQTEVIVYLDTSHILEDDYAKVIIVSKGNNAVDLRLENNIQKNDIVLTQDYGVAIIGLSKDAICINQYGEKYTNYNIDYLLELKNYNRKKRKYQNMKGPRKRRKEDDDRLIQQIENLLK